MIGHVAICAHGRIGIITKYNDKKKVWIGVPIRYSGSARKTWQSKNPKILGKFINSLNH